jgi:hypothetical protein
MLPRAGGTTRARAALGRNTSAAAEAQPYTDSPLPTPLPLGGSVSVSKDAPPLNQGCPLTHECRSDSAMPSPRFFVRVLLTFALLLADAGTQNFPPSHRVNGQ